MKASELAHKLLSLIKKHGDWEVFISSELLKEGLYVHLCKNHGPLAAHQVNKSKKGLNGTQLYGCKRCVKKVEIGSLENQKR